MRVAKYEVSYQDSSLQLSQNFVNNQNKFRLEISLLLKVCDMI